MRQVYRRVVDAWVAAQVELHGQYSLARLESLHAYATHTPMWRVVLVCLSAPLISVVLITLTDSMRLANPRLGLSASHTLWVRAYISVCAIAGGTTVQLRLIVPGLQMTHREVVLLTLVCAAVGVVSQFGVALVIGYPVPFSLVVGTFPCLTALIGGIILPRREMLRNKPLLRQQLQNYVVVWICQIAMTVIYPVYNHIFSRLTATAQTAFVLLLPGIKLLNKNWISHSLRDTDDMRPELVVFNIEIFHALYVSVCMQSSTSVSTTIAIMVVDFLHAWLSLWDVNVLLRDIELLLARVPYTGCRVSVTNGPDRASEVVEANRHQRRRTIIEAAADVLREDERVREHESVRRACFVSSISRRKSASVHPSSMTPGPRVSTIPLPRLSEQNSDHGNSSMDATKVSSPRVSTFTAPVQPTQRDSRVSSEPYKLVFDAPRAGHDPRKVAPAPTWPRKKAKRKHGGLDDDERLLLVQKTLRVLFVTEFVALVEYAEVMIPVIYNTCMIGMVRLPNRAYYKLLATMTDQQLVRTFENVTMYGVLELISFVVFCVLLRHKLRFSVLMQVAFVLENQFAMVQAKLVMWLFYVVQTSLEHFGADFSFSFVWLRAGG